MVVIPSTHSGYIWNWHLASAGCALSASVAYGLLVAADLPAPWALVAAACFGIAYSVLGLGLRVVLTEHRSSVWADTGGICAITGGVAMTMMLTLQLTLDGYLGRAEQVATPEGLEIIQWLRRGTAPIHLGLDVVWDLYLGVATICFAMAFLKHPSFGRMWTWSGLMVGAALLGFNIAAFPFSPGEVGMSMLYAPASAVWYLAVGVRLLYARKREECT